MLRILETELEYMVMFPLALSHRRMRILFFWSNTERHSPYSELPQNETPLFCYIRKDISLTLSHRRMGLPFGWSNTERHSSNTESSQNETPLWLLQDERHFPTLSHRRMRLPLSDPIQKGILLTESRRRMRLPVGWSNMERHSSYTESSQNETPLWQVNYGQAFSLH